MNQSEDEKLTAGQRLAEFVADKIGSWPFIISQSAFIGLWIFVNKERIVNFDPAPFILLNLILSLQAAFTGPMILIAQNRQNEKDRKILYGDFTQDLDTHARLQRVEKKLDRILAKRRNGSKRSNKRR